MLGFAKPRCKALGRKSRIQELKNLESWGLQGCHVRWGPSHKPLKRERGVYEVAIGLL